MKYRPVYFLIPVLLSFNIISYAVTVLQADWSDVVRGNCSDQNSAWWSSSEAIRIAENVLLYQRACGGWPKNTNMQMILTEDDKIDLIAAKPGNIDCTIDNGAVDYELTYLSKVYKAISVDTMKAKIKEGFQLGVQYLLDAQYDNGGWPQFYPLHGGYSDYITYNDDAMIHVMYILKHTYTNDGTYSIVIADSTREQAETAYNKGIECILNTQYVQHGKLTVWCAQHNNKTLKPATARPYELASLSGQESARIITFLMAINNPSNEIKRAIYSAVKWYEEVKITGQRLESFINSDGKSDKRIVFDPYASPMWARFYTLEDNRPFFCDRDGIMKFSIAEIGIERRNGYSWYNFSGNEVSSGNLSWVPKWGTTVLAYPFPNETIYTKDTVYVSAFANKYPGHTFTKFELTLDTNRIFTYTGQVIDTFFTGLSFSEHSIVVRSIYDNGYVEGDSAIFTLSLPLFTLTIYGGLGSGTYPLDSEVVIKANKPPVGKVFDKWTGDTIYIENTRDSLTIFTIPEMNVTIFSTYKNAPVSGIKDEPFEISENICYPNPVYEFLTIDISKTGDARIEIFNIRGQKVYTEEKKQGIHTIPVDFLTPGQYYICITGKNRVTHMTKVLKL